MNRYQIITKEIINDTPSSPTVMWQGQHYPTNEEVESMRTTLKEFNVRNTAPNSFEQKGDYLTIQQERVLHLGWKTLEIVNVFEGQILVVGVATPCVCIVNLKLAAGQDTIDRVGINC